MGTWGGGNFESDTALDHLSTVVDRLVTEVAEAMAGDPLGIEPDEYWGVAVPCNLELLHVLARAGYGHGSLPEAGVVEGWKETFMAVWERTIDELGPSPEYKEERRSVLNRTFDRLAEAVTRGATVDDADRADHAGRGGQGG
ncbi:DUF4259 domain-containing protein [Kitasatospora sp. NA04385]|uniref:DUF4259 domain-containing protein n=1 Tax=Kitasatospora sp. NA04385 TaxID=2742135 RepID=UPI0020CB2820|nr:DUF4259 domain-containing protein [Kitasatospora sp. NA04385]